MQNAVVAVLVEGVTDPGSSKNSPRPVHLFCSAPSGLLFIGETGTGLPQPLLGLELFSCQLLSCKPLTLRSASSD